MNLATIRQGLKARLDTIDGLRAYATAPGSVTPQPGNAVAVIVPSPGTWLVRDSVETYRLTFVVKLLVGAQITPEGQDVLDAYFDDASPQWIVGAIHSNTVPLGGGGEWTAVGEGRGYDNVTYAGVTYFGAEIVVEVGAS